MQNKFMFFENFLTAIEQLPESKRANACYEFCKYGITGKLPDDESLKMFCVGVSASIQKYQGRGGYREGAGRKPKNQNNQNNQKNHMQQTETINRNINNILNNNNIYIYVDDNFLIPVDDFFNQYRKELGNELVNQVENWIKTTQKGKYVDKQFVCKQFINFAQRQNKPLLRA